MHTISVRDFGPVKNIDLNINEMTLMIGEQASGKSTVAKLVYYFRKIKNHFVIMMRKRTGTIIWNQMYPVFASQMKTVFTNTFGKKEVLGNFYVRYNYNQNNYVVVKSDTEDSNFTVHFSHNLWEELKSVYDLKDCNDNSSETSWVMNRIIKIFEDPYESIYIPAGRALLSRQSLLDVIQTNELSVALVRSEYDAFDLIDAMTRDYMKEVSAMRALLAKMEWDSFMRETNEEKKKSVFRYMLRLQKEILKGNFKTDGKDDYILLDDEKKIPVSYASSGQQEVLWITNILLGYAARGTEKTCVIIEEPETHLHPDAQYALAKFIAAFQNITGSQVIITTHSPYVLTSFNNLFFAESCAKKGNTEEIKKIISPYSWIKQEEFQSFCITDGILEDIKDKDQSMVDVSVLDGVASRQDDEYERMAALMWR